MSLGLKALGCKVTRVAPATNLGVLVLVHAYGSSLAGHVGDTRHEVVLGVLKLAAPSGQALDLLVDQTDGLLGRLGLLALALLHEHADLLGLGVALRLKLLDLGDDGAALARRAQRTSRGPRIPWRFAMASSRASGVLANKLDIEHDSSGSHT